MEKKKIILGITGGIAAYKIPELVRIFTKAGHDVRVAMTKNATWFIAPLTFEALSKNRVITGMFEGNIDPLAHISWGQESDLVIIAPATANFIAKAAHGIADDFLSSMVVAATAPMLICPAMNSKMYLNPITQENIKKLNNKGYVIMKPGEGELACNTEGQGRLPDPVDIAEQAFHILENKDLKGLKIMVTAGPTIEPIDPVRYITNRSSGKMGYAIAHKAAMRGADVTLISGPTNIKPPLGVNLIRVNTAEEMMDAVFAHRAEMDAIIKAAAVADFRPALSSNQKIKKSEEDISIKLVKNPDILSELGISKSKPGQILVGFAAETENIMANAKEKLARKNLDMIVVNDVTAKDAGFDVNTNRVTLIFRDGAVHELPLLTKDEVADELLDRVRMIRGKDNELHC
ncbi:MAG: bifunctional phosphopantothenoylcysteine decarboxylase/phosphopantothenate--cysteine ligase CoaBC [Desulfatiglans sp.]|nr:bifunctional phosphopantothenoylcysteine decarboxylase/phosphopantothenate--cysteine ligase CoaBC [Desulfatiglans sp.]